MLIVLALSARSHWDDQRWSDQAQTHRQVEGREDVAVLRGALVDEALLELVEDCAAQQCDRAVRVHSSASCAGVSAGGSRATHLLLRAERLLTDDSPERSAGRRKAV